MLTTAVFRVYNVLACVCPLVTLNLLICIAKTYHIYTLCNRNWKRCGQCHSCVIILRLVKQLIMACLRMRWTCMRIKWKYAAGFISLTILDTIYIHGQKNYCRLNKTEILNLPILPTIFWWNIIVLLIYITAAWGEVIRNIRSLYFKLIQVSTFVHSARI